MTWPFCENGFAVVITMYFGEFAISHGLKDRVSGGSASRAHIFSRTQLHVLGCPSSVALWEVTNPVLRGVALGIRKRIREGHYFHRHHLPIIPLSGQCVQSCVRKAFQHN